MVPSSDDPAASVFPIHAARSLCPACQAATWTSRLCLSHRQPTRQAASPPCHGRRLRAGPRIHLISWHARAAWAATRVPGGAGSYRRRELTRQLRRQRHDGRRQQRPSYRVQWIAPGVDRPTVGIGAATAAGTPGIRRCSQDVAWALAARQRALPTSTPHHGFFPRIRGLRWVSPPAFATLPPDAVCPVGVDCRAVATSEAESRPTPSVVGTEVPPTVHPVGSPQAPVGADSATTGFVWNARRC